MTFQTITAERLNPVIGAEISGVDLSQPLGNQTFQEVHDALMEYGVIFFRDQDITPDQHKDFAGRFGTLQVHPFAPYLEGHPEIIVLHNDEKHPPNINNWHTDVTFMESPPLGSVLHAKTLPSTGGDTMWSNMYAAYEALSDHMQSFLSGLTAIHDHAHVFGKRGLFRTEGRTAFGKGKGADADAEVELPPAEHPVIRTHPVTGKKSLFVNSAFTIGIKDMKPKESQHLLQFLYNHVATPEFQCRFQWRENSIAFWDNRCTQHYALADYWPEVRRMHRVTINGDKPFYRA